METKIFEKRVDAQALRCTHSFITIDGKVHAPGMIDRDLKVLIAIAGHVSCKWPIPAR